MPDVLSSGIILFTKRDGGIDAMILLSENKKEELKDMMT